MVSDSTMKRRGKRLKVCDPNKNLKVSDFTKKRRGNVLATAYVSVDKLNNGMISDRTRDIIKVMDVEKWKKIPEELKVDDKELRRYMFPCLPIEPWLEEMFTKELARSHYSNDELIHVNRVSSQLVDLIVNERISGKYQSEFDIDVGKPLGVKSLLFPSGKGYLVRRNGLKVNAKNLNLSGKHVMLCCLVVPLPWNSFARRVAVTCRDLYSRMENQFEMVIVAIMRDGWTHDEKAFSQFMSGFPSPCLAIPFHAESHRRRVCKRLGGMLMAGITLVSPGGHVLMQNEVMSSWDLHLVPWYHLANPHPFPFIADAEAEQHLTVPSSLEDLLYCRTSDFVFRKNSTGSEAFWKEKLPVFQLKSKLVGLYLYTSGHLLPLLRKIEETCRRSDKELEVVVVYLRDRHKQDPRWYPEIFSTVLAKQNISWWVAPYNNTASVVLKHLFEGEKVIVVGPDGSYVEPYGAEIMQLYGVTAYPFTVKHVAERTLEELSKVTLESFLELLNVRFEHRNSGKNVLFYFDYPFRTHRVVKDAYARFASDTDVVIFPCAIAHAEVVAEMPDGDVSVEVASEVPWHKDRLKSVVVEFFVRFFNGEFPTIVAFGRDGRICSLLAHRLPYSDGAKAFPIRGDLLEEVSFILADYLGRYGDGGLRYNCEPADFEELHELRRSWMS